MLCYKFSRPLTIALTMYSLISVSSSYPLAACPTDEYPLEIPKSKDEYEQMVIDATPDGSTPVSIDYNFLGTESSQVEMYYFTIEPNGDKHRESWGYQYYDAQNQRIRYDQILKQDPAYDATVPGAELMENMIMQNNGLLNININFLGHVTCIFLPDGFLKGLPSVMVLKEDEGNIDYVGIHTILDPKTCKPTGYDVYSVDGFWFNGATLYFYINRDTKILSTQLYFQSELPEPGPNYFWWMYSDMSNGITPEEYQEVLNGKQGDYYFGFSDDHLKSCPNYEELVASGAVDEYSFGNSYNITL